MYIHIHFYRDTTPPTPSETDIPDTVGSLLGDDSTAATDQSIQDTSGQSIHQTEPADELGRDSHEPESFPPLSMSSPPSPTQENIVAFAEKYSLNLASRRFNVSAATIKKWMKSSRVLLKPKYNSPGQGRKISYSAELEQEMVEHVRDLLARGEKVTMQSICNYARVRVQEELPEFTASTGWAHRFLTRNNIHLSDQKDLRVFSRDTSRGQDSRGRPLSYSVETDQALANHVRQRLADGYTLTNSELRRYAKDIIVKENCKFTGSASWAQNFLHRHKINLQSHDSKEPASTSPSPTVPSRVSPSLAASSPSTSLLSTPPPLLNSQAQYVSSVLTSSSHFTSTIPGVSTVSVVDSHLNPATEMHAVASSTPGFPNPSLSDSVMSLPAEYPHDDPMKQALAILTGENIDAGMLSAAQVASLQSTLSELTSDTVSLVDLLNTAQQLHEQSGEPGSAAAHLISHGLDSHASSLYLGLNPNSDIFGSGLTGAAATQVNPNTQAPTVPNPPRPAVPVHREVDTGTSSRPLSYTKETDLMLAKWVQEEQAAGKKVTFASLRAYAKNLVSTENPNFNASVGWVTPFLLRHGLDLSINKKKSSRKAESPADQPSKQVSPSVHHIMDDENPITPEQMMVPVQVVQSEATPEASMMTTPVTSCSPVTLEGIRAVLEQGIQNLATECTQNEQMQFAVQLQEQSLALAHTPTSLSHQVDQTLQDIHVASIDGQILAEGRPQRSKVPPRKFSQEKGEEKISIKKRVKGQRNRHRLAEKLDVVRLMRENNLAPHFVCRMLGIANSTMAGWIKLVQQKGAELETLSLNKKRSNLSGQGRPLTYSREKDEAIAQWVQTQQKMGMQVMPAELAKYAQGLIREENHNFTASSGWAQKFLQRHGLQLAAKSPGGSATPGPSGMTADKSSPAVVEDQHEIPAAVQTEEVIAHEYSQDKPYSEDTEKHLIAWVKENISTTGSLSLQELCRYAEEVVIQQNPMFVASLSWAFMFLYTHNLLLDPKPNVQTVRSTPNPRKRTSSSIQESADDTPQTEAENTPKKAHPDVMSDASVSPSTGNLCEALLALSNQSQDSGQSSTSSVQAVLQVALRALHQQQQQKQQLEVQPEALVGVAELAKEMESEKNEDTLMENVAETGTLNKADECVLGSEKEKEETVKPKGATSTSPEKDSSSNTYFGKSAREFTTEEKEEVVRYANATTLQKAAIKYGVAAPTVWRWRVELKLHQPKYSAMQKKYIIKFAEANSLKEAAQRYGITGKTISNWRKALQADGELAGETNTLLTQDSQTEVIEGTSGDSQSSEVVFHFIVDGGEVVEVTGTVAGNVSESPEGGAEQGAQENPTVQEGGSVPLEVTNEVDIENVGMEYDIVSSEGHVAKPRCTPQEKVQILQYALDHSIKEASQKFGVSPGTLYYWKRTRNSTKEGGKDTVSSQGSAPDQPLQARTHVSPVIEYSDVMEETTSVLASSSEETQPEQFIASSDALSSVSDTQTATIHTLSQALAGISPDALQGLNPDLTLLHAVSSFLTGAGGETGDREGGGGGVNSEDSASLNKRRDSNSGGISSPTEVLVRPFPPHDQATLNPGGVEAESMEHSGVEQSQVEDVAPDVVSEEVVMIGNNANESPIPPEKNCSGEKPLKSDESDSVLQSSSNDVLTTVEPVAMTSSTAGEVHANELTSSEMKTGGQLVPVELEVLAFPPNSSDTSNEVTGNIPLVQGVQSPNIATSSTEQSPPTESTHEASTGENGEASVVLTESSLNTNSSEKDSDVVIPDSETNCDC